MYFDTCPTTVGTHWRIKLCYAQLYRRDVGILLHKPVGNASRYVLDEFGGYSHLLFYDVVHLGIVEGVGYIIRKHGAAYVVANTYIDRIVVACGLLLWQYAVAGMETYVVDMDEREN